MAARVSRLRFTGEDEAPDKEKTRRTVQRGAEKKAASAAFPAPDKSEMKIAAEPGANPPAPRLYFEDVGKKPPSKLFHAARAAPGMAINSTVRRELREADGDNPGREAAASSAVVQQGSRLLRTLERTNKLRTFRASNVSETRYSRGNNSRWQQRQTIKRAYASGTTSVQGLNVKLPETDFSAARHRAREFFRPRRRSFVILLLIAALLLSLAASASSCGLFFDGIASTLAVSTYPSRDSDIRAAEAQYCRMEAELQATLDNYESTHAYDEYRYDLDEIQHDPYVLISAITAMYGGEWRIGEVQGIIQTLFDKQYILTETVETETRQRETIEIEKVPMRDPETGRVLRDRYGDILYEEKRTTVIEDYTYYICAVELENFNLSHVPVYVMDEDTLSMYTVYMAVLGNRPDLFPTSEYIGRYDGNYLVYEIPPEALADEVFAAMIKEAEKYLGYPYVWGGGNPSTSFDCSGFVSWVINNCGVGWSLGRQGTWGLLDACTVVSPFEAKPGDLIFFEGTYDTTGPSHVGIYVGNGMMLHCGDPIQYTSVETSYFQQHFMCYGRLTRP